ncbi:MAG: mismatch-specific DNA-glycosylase [Planctomycetota bacterium]
MLPDVLHDGLSVVFCGTAAGKKSASVSAYYAGPGNKFWRTLHEIGITPVQLRPEEYATLPNYGVGFTDLVKGKAGGDAEMASKDFDTESFCAKIEHYKPAIVCFNGKKAAQTYLDTKKVNFGLATQSIGSSKIFIAPSTSGAANGYWDVQHWHSLGKLYRTERTIQ